MVIVHSTKIEGFGGCVSQESEMCPFLFSFVLGFGSHVKVELRSILSLT